MRGDLAGLAAALVVLAAGCASTPAAHHHDGAAPTASTLTLRADTGAGPATAAPAPRPKAAGAPTATAGARGGHLLPQGCGLGIEGETIGALVDNFDAFHFRGYNAVPPGHPIAAVLISWGDGSSSPGTAQALPKPFAPGCLVTVFTARHRYTRVGCHPNGLCSTVYRVTVSYRDTRTGIRHTLRKLAVDILKPERPAARPAHTSTTTGSTIGRRRRRS